MAKPVGKTVQEIRVSQFSIQNEQLVLSCLMNDRSLLRDLYVVLDRNIFAGDRHRTIFSVLQEIASRKLVFEIKTFERLAGNKVYGGVDYLNKIFELSPETPENINWHIDKLNEDAVKRNLRVGPLAKLIDGVDDPNVSLDDISGYIQELNAGIVGNLSREVLNQNKLYQAQLLEWKARRENVGFIPTGYWELDEKLTEGLARKKVSVWAGRPGMGKSTFVWNIVERTNRLYNTKVLYVPLEMSKEAVLDGMVSSRTNILLDKIVKGMQDISASDLKLMNQEMKRLTKDGTLSFYDSFLKFDRLARILNEGNYDVAVFDLWEKLVPHLEANVIAEYLNKTQQLAKDTDTHIQIVHQIKRGMAGLSDHRPTMSLLKNSGAYEEVSDLIIGLNREKYYDVDLEDNNLEVGIMKQRRGSSGMWFAYEFLPQYGRVGDYVETFYE